MGGRMTTRLFIAYEDNIGARRAWAKGSPDDPAAVLAEARRQFRRYAKEKLKLGSFRELCPFRVIRTTYEED